MGRLGRWFLIGAGLILAVLVIGAIAFRQFFDINDYKPQIESAVAKATGMQVAIKGESTLNLFPRVRIVLRNVHLANRGSELFSAEEVSVAPHVMPFLLHREVNVGRVSLLRPKIRIEKDPNGRMNYETTQKAQPSREPAGEEKGRGPGSVRSVRVEDGEITYSNRSSGSNIMAKGVDIDLSNVAWDAMPPKDGAKSNPMKSVTLNGRIAADSFKTDTVSATTLKADLHDDHGLIRLDNTEANVFGGVARGNAQIDLRGSVPKFQVAQSSSHVDLGQLTMKKDRVSGAVRADVNIATAGSSSKALKKAAAGHVAIQGENITVTGVNVDETVGKLKSAQGAGLGEIGTALLNRAIQSKANAGSEQSNPNAKTVVEKLVANWKVSDGVATAEDVALATGQNIVAFKGNVDLVNRSYRNFYVATVDPQGCSRTKIEIAGQIDHPKPNVRGLAEEAAQPYVGEAKKELESKARSKIGEWLGGAAQQPLPTAAPERKPASETAPKQCDHFYSGTVLRKPSGG